MNQAWAQQKGGKNTLDWKATICFLGLFRDVDICIKIYYF